MTNGVRHIVQSNENWCSNHKLLPIVAPIAPPPKTVVPPLAGLPAGTIHTAYVGYRADVCPFVSLSNLLTLLNYLCYEKEITYPAICDGGDSRQRI